MQRLQRLALTSLVGTLILTAIGAYTRGSGSGYGCRDRWPLCENGLLGGLFPRWEFHMVVEWTHRWVAAIVVLLIATTVVVAWRTTSDRRIRVPAASALAAVILQAAVGAAVVQADLRADLVSLHLVIAMTVLALISIATVNASELVRDGGPAPSVSYFGSPEQVRRIRRLFPWSRTLAIAAGGVLAVLLLGSDVHDQYVAGWPLVGDAIVPDLDGRVEIVHFLHRTFAAMVLVALGWLAYAQVKLSRPKAETSLVHTALALYVVNVGFGAAHVFTEVSSPTLIVAHLGLTAAIWTALVSAAALARWPEAEARRLRLAHDEQSA